MYYQNFKPVNNSSKQSPNIINDRRLNIKEIAFIVTFDFLHLAFTLSLFLWPVLLPVLSMIEQ